jgi:hypothetical protein
MHERLRGGPGRAGLALALFLAAAGGARAQDAVAGRKHAVVFGINGTSSPFAGIPTLGYAEKDALAMAELLGASGWDVARIPWREGTRARIVAELARLARETVAEDTVLLYFAGHGIRDPGPGEHTYWVTYQVSPRELPVEGIRLTHLLDYVDEIPAQRKLVILDHCYSGDVEIPVLGADGPGADRGPGDGVSVVRKAFPIDDVRSRVEESVQRGLVILGAAREEAYEFEDLGHGIYTWALLEALGDERTDSNGNGRIAITELIERIKGELETLAPAHPIRQVPIEIVRGSDLTSWEPFDAVVGGAQALRQYVDELALQADVDLAVQGRVFAAINRWDAARRAGLPPDPKDQKVVDLVNKLRDLEDSVDAETKSQLLVSRMGAL